jgi:uncharacterized protein YecE (DUF72 family)
MRVGSAHLWVGCSGWSYDDWSGRFYPPGLPAAERLAWYASRFDAVEVNATHYRTPTTAAVAGWRDATAADFHFAVKLHRFGTHRKKLTDPDGWVPRPIDPIAPPGDRAGTVLLQLPPRWRPRIDRLDRALAVIGRRHRIAVEVRDERWLGDELDRVLDTHGAVRVHHDLLPLDPASVATARFEYWRFHGPDRADPYHGRYDGRHLRGVARRVAESIRRGRDVEAYFNNDVGAAAPADAARFRDQVLDELGRSGSGSSDAGADEEPAATRPVGRGR